MSQRGWATATVLMACALMSASTLAVWLDLAHSQRGWAQRHWLWQAQAAAEAVLRDAQQAWGAAAPAPREGCSQGRCAWQGADGLARSHWQSRLDQAAWSGCAGTPAWRAGWPTLPGVRLACWAESTPHPAGTLVRLTAWVQGESASQVAVLQAVWQVGGSAGSGQWLSWREVMP